MPDQVTTSNRFDIHEYYTKSFRIKLFRENVYDQITSWVISYRTNKWHVTKEDNLKEYTVPKFDQNWLNRHVNKILTNNKKVDEFMPNNETDMCLKYEDIKSHINSQYVLRPKPTNYQEVYERVVSAVNKKLGVENV